MSLTAEESRCDRCGAQAYVRTQHADLSLLWCAHHSREHAGGQKPFIVAGSRAPT